MAWPFENDTSAVEKQLADRSLAANRRRNNLAGIIILSASFLLSFTTILLCNATIYGKISYGMNNANEVLVSIVGIAFILLCTAGLTAKTYFMFPFCSVHMNLQNCEQSGQLTGRLYLL